MRIFRNYSLKNQLIKRAKKAKHIKPSIADAVKDMFKICMTHFAKVVPENADEKTIINIFRDINRTWNKVSARMSKLGFIYITKDGFKNILLTHEVYKSVAEKI